MGYDDYSYDDYDYGGFDIPGVRQRTIYDRFGMDPSLESDPLDFLDPRRRRKGMSGFRPELVGGSPPQGYNPNVTAGLELPPNQAPPMNELDMLKALYTPQTEATERYNQFLRDVPQMDQNPSFGRKLVASMAGAKGGVEGAEKALHAPYIAQMADWTARGKPIYDAANLERQENVQNRTIATNTINAKVAGDKLLAHEREVEKNNASRERIAAEKNALLREKQNGAQVEFSNGHAIVHRLDGTVYEAPVDLTNWSALEIAQVQAKAGQARTETQGQTARDVANIRANAPQVFNIYSQTDPNTPPTAQVVRPGDNTASPITSNGTPVGSAQKPTGAGTGSLKQPNPVDLKAIQEFTQETLTGISELIDEKGNLTGPAKAFYGAGAGLGLGKIMLTDAKTGQTRHNHVMGELVLDLIGRLKNQSRTGATGFGQLSGPELAILESAAQGIDPAQDPEETKRRLIQIRDKLKKIVMPVDGSNPTINQPGTKLDQAIRDILRGVNP